MNLDDAIKHAKEVSETAECEKCRTEHLQLTEWLTELKELREQQNSIIKG